MGVAVEADQSFNAPTGLFWGQQLIAAIFVVLLTYVAARSYEWNRQKRAGSDAMAVEPEAEKRTGPDARGGLLMGWDGRSSTSKAVALAWTLVVAYMVVTTGMMAITQERGFFQQIFSEGDSENLELYLVLLGGPYAAAILAKVAVTSKIDHGTLQKTEGPGRQDPAHIVGGDQGAADLPDFQYTLFNLIGILIVLGLFVAEPGEGAPPIPGFLAALLGGSALAYTANKAAQSNGPRITDVVPAIARVSEQVTLYGANLHLPSDKDAKPTVTVGGVSADVQEYQGDRVVFTVPHPASGTGWSSRAQDVRVKTIAGATADAPAALRIVEDVPLLEAIDPQLLALGSRAVLAGDYFLGAGKDAAAPLVRVEWDKAGQQYSHDIGVLDKPAPTRNEVTFVVPVLPNAPEPPFELRLSVRRDGKTSRALGTTLQPPAKPEIVELEPGRARAGAVVTIRGRNLAFDATAGAPTVTVAGMSADVIGQGDTEVKFRVPAVPAGAWDVKLAKTPDAVVVAPTQLQIDDDKPVITGYPAEVAFGRTVTLVGAYFFPLAELDEAQAPKPGALDKVRVRLTWTLDAQQKHLELRPDEGVASTSDNTLTATIRVQLDLGDQKQAEGRMSVIRDGVSSAEVAVLVRGPR